MKVLKESTNKLPIEFITSFISKGWDEIGVINASVEGIKKEFSNTKGVADALTELADAYLICIGRLEGYLDKKDYVDLPEEEELTEALTEEVNIQTSAAEPVIEKNMTESVDTYQEEDTPKENFEYFVDFDEPEPDAEADADIKAWLNSH